MHTTTTTTISAPQQTTCTGEYKKLPPPSPATFVDISGTQIYACNSMQKYLLQQFPLVPQELTEGSGLTHCEHIN